MTAMTRLLRRLEGVPMFVASVTLFSLMVLTFADVILRSAFNAPIEAATELTRIAIAIMVFSALPVLSARGEHIAVDLLDGFFRRWRLERWRDGLVALACGAMLWWPASRVADLAQRAKDYGDRTEYLAIPTYILTWFIAAMTFLTALILIARGLLHLLAPRLLEHPHD